MTKSFSHTDVDLILAILVEAAGAIFSSVLIFEACFIRSQAKVGDTVLVWQVAEMYVEGGGGA